MNTMEYKGYVATVEYDPDADLLHGEVINTRSVLTFQGKSVAELKVALSDTVEDYLNWCQERGQTPEKPYSGKLMLRLSPDLHRKLALEAAQRHTSLNSLIIERLAP